MDGKAKNFSMCRFELNYFGDKQKEEEKLMKVELKSENGNSKKHKKNASQTFPSPQKKKFIRKTHHHRSKFNAKGGKTLNLKYLKQHMLSL